MSLDAVRRANRGFQAKSWGWCFLVIVLLKLVLVAHSEVETGFFDEVGYANSSLHWFGEDDVRMSNFERPPGLPLFAAAMRGIGLPYRGGIELLSLLSIGWLSFAFGRLAGSYLIAIIMAGMLAFHPWLFVNAVSFMSEPLFLALSLGWLACLAGFLQADHLGNGAVRWMAASGLFLLLMTLTRLENAVLLWFGVGAGIALMIFTRVVLKLSASLFSRWYWLFFFLPLGILVAGRQLVCCFNEEKCGVAALSCLEAPGLGHLLQSLNEIQAPDPQRYAPITTRSFAMAMEASPSLHLLAEPMARDRTLAQSSPKPYLPGERGWFLMWDLIHSSEEMETNLPCESSEPKKLNAYWERCAQELQLALRDGKLPRACYAPYPLNPNYNLWIRYYPRSWWNEFRFLWSLHGKSSEGAYTYQSMLRIPWSMNAYLLLNQAAGRRAALVPSSYLEGFAYSKSGPVDNVILEDADGLRLGAAFALRAEPLPAELAKWVPQLPGGAVPCCYSIHLPFAIPNTSRLILIKDGRRVSTQPISESYHIEFTGVSAPGADGMAEIRSQEIHGSDAAAGWREQVTRWIIRHYRWMEIMSCAVCFLIAFASERPREKRRALRPRMGIFLGIMMGCIIIRNSFYALSDACTLPDWSRYPQALSLWIPVLLIGASFCLGDGLAISSRVGRKNLSYDPLAKRAHAFLAGRSLADFFSWRSRS